MGGKRYRMERKDLGLQTPLHRLETKAEALEAQRQELELDQEPRQVPSQTLDLRAISAPRRHEH